MNMPTNKRQHEAMLENLGLNLVLQARLYRRELDEALKTYGLSEANTLPIRYLARLGKGVRQGILAEALDLEGPTLVRVLDQLQAIGLIARVDTKNDRRVKIVELTPEGKALNKKLRKDLKQLRERLFAGINETDLQACLRVFEQLDQNLRSKSQPPEVT
ncbi:MarR family winged helix-turn-helix transcriptional regulator [Pseudomonas fildesensis]|uniref:MarR family winged helix-turn-helix transcriptional regulator n=1 Tax=Pseudomonas fildesensis TaxID=1674920 RepID=UPI00387B4238